LSEPDSAVAAPLSAGWSTRVLLAACSLGAASIHLAMVPSHASEWYAEGLAFAFAGWLQLALAVMILARPSRLALWVCCAANGAFVAAWVWTRTSGPPFGPEQGVPHDAGFVDITAVCLEVTAIVIAAFALARPAARGEVRRAAVLPAAMVGLGVLVVATVAITSPSASDHAHGEAGHSHPASEEASSHEHTGGADHAHETDADGGSSDDFGLAALHNGEMSHEYGPDQPLDEPTRTLLVHQLALTRLIAERFPTLGDARAAGSKPAGAFGPGLGIHMSTPSSGMPEVPPPDPSVPTIPGTLSDAEILRPANLLYAGSTDDAPLAGFMYYSTTADEPEGFAGPNDHWHTHSDLCLDLNDPDGIGVLNTDEPTREACEKVGGFWYEQTQWMVHVWTIPGYESNQGVFSDINPAITCPDGTYYVVPEEQTDRYQLNHCLSNPS
jgi:hypothetical protein